MQNHKTNYWVLLFITILASGFTLSFLRNISSQNFLIEQFSSPLKKNIYKTSAYNLKIEKISESPFWYKNLDLDYPTGNLPGIELAQHFVENQKDSFDCMNDSEKISEEEAQLEPGLVSTLSCDLSVSYSYVESSKLITHVFDIYYFMGGAHGIFHHETIVVDKNGNKKKFSDFVKQDYKETYSNKIAQILKNRLISELEKNNLDLMDFQIDYIFEENSIDELPFLVENEKIIFLFSEFQGLSRAVGPVVVEVPINDLADILNINFFI